jgi:hypothetical protein
MGRTPERVEKLMALTLGDFHRSLKVLAPDISLREEQTEVSIPAGGKSVHIRFAAQEGATLGGLLALPRARVTLIFNGMGESEREAFLVRFDRAFQRGGG